MTKQEKINELLFVLIHHLYLLSIDNKEGNKCEFSNKLYNKLEKLKEKIEQL